MNARFLISGLAGLLLATVACGARAAELVVFDDALRNGFQDESYPNGGGIDLDNAAPVRAGNRSIAFDGLSFGAVALRRTAGLVSSQDYPSLRLWLHGGASGGQQLRLWLIDTGSAQSAHVDLDALLPGGALQAGTWLQVEVPLTAGALAARPQFDRIEIQSDVAAAQPTLYLDDIALLPPDPAADRIFASRFEAGEAPVYLFVPQWSGNGIRIYRQSGQDWQFLRAAPLGAGIRPNALAFDHAGRLWLSNDGVASQTLRRYARADLLGAANPAPQAEIGPIGGGALIGLAVHGDSLYVTRGFGSHAVLRYTLASIEVSGNPAPVATFTAAMATPAGLAFDATGKLWVSNYDTDTLVRLGPGGTAEWVASNAAVGATRNALNRPEGLAFDASGALWVGNNGEATISIYGAAQLAASGASAPAPLQQIDVEPGFFGGDTAGGLAFDALGQLWVNYQRTEAVLGFAPAPLQDGSYAITALPSIAAGSSYPGFGGLAIWPVPPTLQRGAPPASTR